MAKLATSSIGLSYSHDVEGHPTAGCDEHLISVYVVVMVNDPLYGQVDEDTSHHPDQYYAHYGTNHL